MQKIEKIEFDTFELRIGVSELGAIVRKENLNLLSNFWCLASKFDVQVFVLKASVKLNLGGKMKKNKGLMRSQVQKNSLTHEC